MRVKDQNTAETKRAGVLEATLRLMKQRGLKSMTMDALAAELIMSKRTLYEMFGSKHELIAAAIDLLYSRLIMECRRIYRESDNAIVAMAHIFHQHNRVVEEFSVEFFRDIDTLYPEIGNYYHKSSRRIHSELETLFERGLEEGVFRDDVNHLLLAQMHRVQMDAIKRDEEHVCGEFPLEDVIRAVHIGFLRSIASAKGNEELDRYLKTTDKINGQHK